MAQKPYVIESQQREARQRLYTAAPVLGELHPSVKELVVELRFVDPENKVHPSPHKRIFVPDMQAFFEFHCPLKDCTGGGFSLSETIQGGLSGRRSEISGKLSCEGKRKRESSPDPCCRLELHYHATAIKKDRAAA
jgi:hypothetical protein